MVLQKFRKEGRIRLFEFLFMSNHYHLLGEDLGGCLPEFIGALNSMLSKQLNALRGFQGANFSRKPYGLLEVSGEERTAEHAVYTLNNPVAAYRVAKSRHWKGTSSLKLDYGKPRIVNKPRFGLWSRKARHASGPASQRSGRAAYANRSALPDKAELVIDRPPIMRELTDAELRQKIRDRLAQRESDVAEQRARTGRKVAGFRASERVHFLAVPGKEELFAKNPTFSADRKQVRERLKQIHAAFVSAYRAARDAFYKSPHAERGKIKFPAGTYRLRIRDRVTCVPLCVP